MSTVTPKKYQCHEPGCGKAYTQAHNLKSHHDSAHRGLKPYRCEPCARDFARKSDFEIHHQAQHGENFSCTVRVDNNAGSSICGKQFTRRTKLKKHQLKAHGLAPVNVPRARASDASHEPPSDETAAPPATSIQPIPPAAPTTAEGVQDDHNKVFEVLRNEMIGFQPLGSFRYLLQHFPNVNVQLHRFSKQTLAHYAARNENSTFLEACMACGANLTLEDDRRNTPFHEACIHLRATNVELILRASNPIRRRDTLLHLGVPHGNYPLQGMIRRLVQFHQGDAMPKAIELGNFRRTLAVLSDRGITRMMLYFLDNHSLRRFTIGFNSSSQDFRIVRENTAFGFRFTSDLAVPGGCGVAIQS